MKKYIVLGVNENPKYLYFLPLIMWAWSNLGWEFILFYTTEVDRFRIYNRKLIKYLKSLYPDSKFYRLTEQQEIKSETLAQVSRLYGACLCEGYFMTSDVDMLPLSDYWKFDENEVTTWGRDLTDYHYPMCYIGMNQDNWRRVMHSVGSPTSMLLRDVRKRPNMWTFDQDLITDRLLNYSKNGKGGKLIEVKRGTDKRTGYPLGRVDRSNWRLDHDQLIDCHMPHDILTNDESFRKVMQLLHLVWPKEDFKWFLEYHRDFKKLL